jgi:hypothetical protein
VCALVVALAAPAGASAASFYVNGAVGASGDCLSPGAACKTITEAVAKNRASGEADTINVAAGTYEEQFRFDQAGDSGLTIAGVGAGSDPSTNTIIQSTSSANPPVIMALPPNTLLNIRGVRVVVGGSAGSSAISSSGTAAVIGSAAAPVVVDMANASNSSGAVTVSAPAANSSRFDHFTLGGNWTGTALQVGGNVTIVDSRVSTGPTGFGIPASLTSPGTVTIQRSVIAKGNPAAISGPVVDASRVDLTIDSSEILGSAGVSFTPGSDPSRMLAVLSSTIDAGELGKRDAPGSTAAVSVGATGSGHSAVARVVGSILVEAPRSTVSGGGSASITCIDTDVIGTAQAASSSLGQIDCATGTNGNTFTQSLGDMFANPAPDYALKPGWPGIDSVQESALAPPSGHTPSPTDFAGAPRVVNGLDTCAAGLRDKGALELAGHEGIVPAAAVAGPSAATAGVPVAFSASAPNEPAGTALTFAWTFSDGTTASGPEVSHAFSAVGPASATVTVTAPNGCTGTATASLAVVAVPAVLDTITGLRISPSAFFAKRSGASVVPAAKRPVGAVVRYTGTQPATTSFSVQHARAGRRQGRACRKPSRKNRRGRRCTYYTGAGSFKHKDAAGAVRFRFTGRVGGRALRKGRYRLKAVPRNAAGVGRAVYRKFKIRG